MQRMHGTPVTPGRRAARRRASTFRALARAGVEIFFTQVFRDGFFHADMHPGNILVDAATGRYIALDFGIMGTLTEVDKNYLAQNFLAFFRRDYRRVAQAHIESGWVPPDTRVDEFEAAIRAVCEPIFDRPLKEISFGRVLLRLFQTSRRFNIEVQPQLVLLQKTLLNIEGLGPPARSRPRPVADREAVPRALDVASRSAGAACVRTLRQRGAVLGAARCRSCRASCTGALAEDRARRAAARAARARWRAVRARGATACSLALRRRCVAALIAARILAIRALTL